MSLHNGYRYAELARGESLCSPDTCDHCGRQELKKTIKLVNPEGRVVWLGVGCAARAMGTGLKEVKAAKAAAEATLAHAERTERQREQDAEDAVWQAFLDRNAPSESGNRFKQIAFLGGWESCRALYRTECALGLVALELKQA